MIKKLVIFLLLIFVIAISGCLNQGGTEVKGGPGIVITDFSADYSPIYAGDPVGWNIEVQNQGEYSTSISRVTWYGINPTDWALSGTNPDTTLHPVAGTDPVTGFEGGTWTDTRSIRAPSTISSETTFDLGVRVEYYYETRYTATIRVVNSNYLRTLPKDERDTLISSGGIRQSTATAAPLTLKAASGAHFVARESGTTLTVPFRITNVGSGFPYNPGSASVDAAVTANDLYEVRVANPQGIVCDTTNPVVLSRGKNGGFGCTLSVPAMSTITNYEDRTFSVTLQYRYYVDGSTALTVNPQYGTTSGSTAPTTSATTAPTTASVNCGSLTTLTDCQNYASACLPCMDTSGGFADCCTRGVETCDSNARTCV